MILNEIKFGDFGIVEIISFSKKKYMHYDMILMSSDGAKSLECKNIDA